MHQYIKMANGCSCASQFTKKKMICSRLASSRCSHLDISMHRQNQCIEMQLNNLNRYVLLALNRPWASRFDRWTWKACTANPTKDEEKKTYKAKITAFSVSANALFAKEFPLIAGREKHGFNAKMIQFSAQFKSIRARDRAEWHKQNVQCATASRQSHSFSSLKLNFNYWLSCYIVTPCILQWHLPPTTHCALGFCQFIASFMQYSC